MSEVINGSVEDEAGGGRPAMSREWREKELHAAYVEACEVFGFDPVGRRKFVRACRDLGCRRWPGDNRYSHGKAKDRSRMIEVPRNLADLPAIQVAKEPPKTKARHGKQILPVRKGELPSYPKFAVA